MNKAMATKTKNEKVIQSFGTIIKMPIGLKESVCLESCRMLNSILADTMTLRDMYKKHHWQVQGPTFYELHLLFDKHFNEQAELVDEIAERIQMLGGISIAMAQDVAELSAIPRAPSGREAPDKQLARLLDAHEIVLKKIRAAICKTDELGDDGTNDLLMSDVLRTNEMQVWFISSTHTKQ